MEQPQTATNLITDILGATREGGDFDAEWDVLRAMKVVAFIGKVTSGLTPESTEIARGELAEHYRMAYSRHRASGAFAMNAHEAAMRDLGSEMRLWWQYQKRLLTKDDQKFRERAAVSADYPLRSLAGRLCRRLPDAALWFPAFVVAGVEYSQLLLPWALSGVMMAYILTSALWTHRLCVSGRIVDCIRVEGVIRFIDRLGWVAMLVAVMLAGYNERLVYSLFLFTTIILITGGLAVFDSEQYARRLRAKLSLSK